MSLVTKLQNTGKAAIARLQSLGLKVRNQIELAKAWTGKRLGGTVIITLKNNASTDRSVSLLENKTMVYPAGTVFDPIATGGSELTFSTNVKGGWAGLRNLFKQKMPFICGIGLKIGDEADSAQFGLPFDLLSSTGTNQNTIDLLPLILAGETGNSEEQILRVLDWQGTLDDLNDLVFTVKAGTELQITLNIPYYYGASRA